MTSCDEVKVVMNIKQKNGFIYLSIIFYAVYIIMNIIDLFVFQMTVPNRVGPVGNAPEVTPDEVRAFIIRMIVGTAILIGLLIKVANNKKK